MILSSPIRNYHLSVNRSQFGAFPSFLQMVLAACCGVAIGFMVVALIHSTKRPFHLAPPHETLTTTEGEANRGLNPFSSLASLVPSLDHHLNILLMGVDSNGRNTQRFVGTRSDTMIIVGLDPQTKKVGVVSIPRDSRVIVADGHGEDKINAAHAYGGPDLAVATVQSAFSIPIDRYVVVDVQGLKKLFEILGPIDVLVEKRMSYTDNASGLHIALDSGLQGLDSGQAEQYVRFRHDAKGDIGRIERQQWFLRQVFQKMKDPHMLLKLPDIFQAANQYVITNLTVEEMAQIANFAKDIETTQVETATAPGKAQFINGGSYWIPDIDACNIVFNRVLNLPRQSSLQSDRFMGQDVVFAADSTDSAQSTGHSSSLTDPISIGIRYAKGSESTANSLATLATSLGYNVKSNYRVDAADCQHEQIIENSVHADAETIERLRHRLPSLSSWPLTINLDLKSPVDLTLIISPQSYIEAARLPTKPISP